MDGRANPLMDSKVVGVVFFGVAAVLALVTSPTLLGVVWCSAVVVVVVVVAGVVVVVLVLVAVVVVWCQW